MQTIVLEFMDDDKLQSFADNYDVKTDFKRIEYLPVKKANGNYQDPNRDFRIQLCEFLIPKIDTANSQLIRDLFVEEAKATDIIFAVYLNIHVLAQELLKRDWKKYIHDYLEAGSHSMDAYLGIGRIKIDKEIARQIHSFLIQTIKTTQDLREKGFAEPYLLRFESMSR